MSRKKFLLAFSTIVLVAIGWLFYALPYMPPREYPSLSNTERQRMDLKLFNELSVVNKAWPPRKTFEMRQQLILDMAKQGFEVADLAYQLLDVKYGMSGRHWLLPTERASYRHLLGLADQGDPSAQCLTALVIIRWNLNMRDYERYVVKAADAGQPYCTDILSGLLTIHIGSNGLIRKPYWQRIPKNDVKGKELAFSSAKMGVEKARLYLMSSFAHGKDGYPLNIGKAKCWLSLAEEVNTGAALAEKPNLNWLIQQAQKNGFNVSEQYDPKQWCETKLTQH